MWPSHIAAKEAGKCSLCFLWSSSQPKPGASTSKEEGWTDIVAKYWSPWWLRIKIKLIALPRHLLLTVLDYLEKALSLLSRIFFSTLPRVAMTRPRFTSNNLGTTSHRPIDSHKSTKTWVGWMSRPPFHRWRSWGPERWNWLCLKPLRVKNGSPTSCWGRVR